MGTRFLQHSFGSGEITPEMFGRIDLPKRMDALALCRNFQTLPHGPAINRPGTMYVREVKDSTKATRLIRFSYNNEQTFAVEMGAGYFRFHTEGSTLLAGSPTAYNAATAYAIGDMCSSGGVNYYCIAATTGNAPPNATYWYAMPTTGEYEIPNPYAEADLFDIHYVQSADVLTLVHVNYPVMELRRYGATNWQTSLPDFNPPANTVDNGSSVTAGAFVVGQTYTIESIGTTDFTLIGASANTVGVVFTATGVGTGTGTATVGGVVAVTGTGTTTYKYQITTVDAGTLEESLPLSYPIVCQNDLSTSGNHNLIQFNDPSASSHVRYFIYKEENGVYGYIGECSDGTTGFTDDNIVPDVSSGYPLTDTLFAATNDYPQAVGYDEQRRGFAGSLNDPQDLWMTRPGTESDMGYSIPTRDDNRIAVRLAAREASAIRHIVPVLDLLLLSASCEWRVQPTSGLLAPSTFSVKPQSYIGSSMVIPVVVNNIVIFAADRGGHIREMSYRWQAGGYLTADLSLLAPHLFDYYSIVDMAYAASPIPTVWCVSSNGDLLGMTYVPEQQVAAWHHHDTLNGTFESVCTITENDLGAPVYNQDTLYCIVNRTINGTQKRFVEMLHSRYFPTLADAFFVDCGATYSGAAATKISGFDWLIGETVNILADGAVVAAQVVASDGSITLPIAASTVQAGLPITAQLQTPPLAQFIYSLGDQAMAQGRPKNVNRVFLRLYRSSGIYAGPDFNNLQPFAQRTNEPYGSPPDLISDEVEIVLDGDWQYSGQVCVQQTDPLPLDIAALTAEVAIGGGI